MRPNQYDYPSIRTALHPANCKRYSEGNGVFDLYGLVAEYTTPSLSRKLATLRAWGATTLLVVRATTRGAMTTTQEAVSRGNRQAMLHALQDEEGPGWSISGKIARGLASYCLFDGEESGTQAPYAKSTDTYGWDVATDPAMLRTCRDKRRHLIARYVERKLHRWASSRSYLRRLEQLPLPPAHNVNSHAGNEAAGSASGTAFRTASGAASTSPLQPFDVFCKVLHMECLGPSWVVLVWDGTDAPLVQPDSWRRLTCGRQQPPQGGQRQQQLLLQPQGQQGQPVVSDAAPTPLEDALMRLKEDTALFRTFPATGSIIPLLIDSTCDLAAPSTRQPQGSTARPILGLQPGEWAYMRNVSCTLWCGAELILALDSKQGPLPSSGTGAGPRTAMPAGWPDRNVGGSSSALQGNHPHQSDTGSGGGAGVAMRGPRPLQGVVQVFTAAAGALGEERARESERAAAGVAAVTFVRGRPMVPSACYATCAAQLMRGGAPRGPLLDYPRCSSASVGCDEVPLPRASCGLPAAGPDKLLREGGPRQHRGRRRQHEHGHGRGSPGGACWFHDGGALCVLPQASTSRRHGPPRPDAPRRCRGPVLGCRTQPVRLAPQPPPEVPVAEEIARAHGALCALCGHACDGLLSLHLAGRVRAELSAKVGERARVSHATLLPGV
eukprot:jgi/Mesvir1/8794/Mv02699-RA.6